MLHHKLLLGLLLLLLIGAAAVAAKDSFYDFTVPGHDGKGVALSQYRDAATKKPVVLVVNVASKCGFTDSNYRQLQQLYNKVS